MMTLSTLPMNSAIAVLDRSRRPALCDRTVHRQRRERHQLELSGAVDEYPLHLVAPACGPEPGTDRARRYGAGGRALRPDGACVLAAVLGGRDGKSAVLPQADTQHRSHSTLRRHER